MADLNVSTQLRASADFQLVTPANTNSYVIEVPYDETEWASPHRLLIEAIDGSGFFWGSSDNTKITKDKQGNIRPFGLSVVAGIEREDVFPSDRRAGRTIIIDGVHYRQVLFDSPMTIRITIDEGRPQDRLTYGVIVTAGEDVVAASIRL